MHNTSKTGRHRAIALHGASLPYAVILLFLLLLSSCAGPSSSTLISEISSSPGDGVYIEGVPFHPQQEYMCGPSALASVFGYYGRGPGMQEISYDVYEERLRGTLPLDMLIYAKERGMDARYYAGGLDDLKERLRAGTPLILFLNLGFREYPVGHYIVATGFSESREAVIAHYGRQKDRVISFRELLRTWEKTGYSTLLITPKEGGGR